MAVKPEDAITYFGYTPEQLEGFEDIDAFKTDVEKKYIARENYFKLAIKDPEVTGKLFGTLSAKAKAIAKSYGVELQPEEIKEQPVEKVFELGFSKLASASAAALEEVKKQSGARPEEIAKEWEGKLTLEKKSKEDFKAALETLQGEFKNYQETVKLNEKKSLKEREWDRAIAKVNFSPTVLKDPFRKKGWIDTQREMLDLEIDDDKKIYPVNKDGHRIKNPKIASGLYDDLAEVLSENAAKDGVLELNPHTKQVVKPFTPPSAPSGNGNGTQDKSVRKINTYNPNVNTPEVRGK